MRFRITRTMNVMKKDDSEGYRFINFLSLEPIHCRNVRRISRGSSHWNEQSKQIPYTTCTHVRWIDKDASGEIWASSLWRSAIQEKNLEISWLNQRVFLPCSYERKRLLYSTRLRERLPKKQRPENVSVWNPLAFSICLRLIHNSSLSFLLLRVVDFRNLLWSHTRDRRILLCAHKHE